MRHNDDVFNREPPQDIAAERGVLGAMLLDYRAAEVAVESVEAEAFFNPRHRKIFEVFKDLLNVQPELDWITARAALEKCGLENAEREVSALIDEVPNAVNIERFCRLVRQKARARKIHEAIQRIAMSDFDPDVARLEIEYITAESDLGEVPGGNMIDLARRVAELALSGEASMKTLPTGVADGAFDKLIGGGVVTRQYWVIASLPSFGKSTLLNAIARGVYRISPDAGRPLLLTTEMDPESIATVALGMEAGVHTRALVNGQLSEPQRDAVRKAMDRGSGLEGVEIQWVAGRSIGAIRSIAKLHKRRHGLPLIIVDLGRGLEMRGERRVDATAAISNGLKSIPVELDCCLIACTHLNRQHFNDGREPSMNDIRDSNSFAEDADKILLLHRIRKEDPPRIYTKIIQDKNRLYRDESELLVEYLVAHGRYRHVQGESS